MYSKWNDILDQHLCNPQDQFRCKFFVKLVTHLSSYLSNKLSTLKEFGQHIDAAYNIKGITDNSNFTGNAKKRSPL